MKYEVLVNDVKVWESDGPGDTELEDDEGTFDREIFPIEYRIRPGYEGSACQELTDEITLITGGEIITVNRHEDAPTPEPQVYITGTGGGVVGETTGKGG